MTSSGYLQTVNYRYNIRGQLTSINNSKLANDGGKTSGEITGLFGMQIMYDNPDANISGATPSYSGRVSAVKWMTVNGTVGTQTNERSYAYTYDKLERYTGSVYAERTPASTSGFNVNMHGFDEYNITYDDNGNILTLRRNSSSIGNTGSYTTVDRLHYAYNANIPNQLASVTDSAANALGFYYKSGNAGRYTYDTEGNLTVDPQKGLTNKYTNVLNKCDSITVTGTGMITYAYDAGGNVLRKNVYNSSGTQTSSLDYIGGMVFSSGAISYMAMPEGRVLNTGGALTPEYVISDQQGNARMSFQDNGSGAVQVNQENSYYAYGEVLAGSPVGTPGTPNPNLYNGGSEWQSEFNNLPDYHQTFFRNYDPEIGRFTGADPKPESADGMTVYQYAGDDPVNMNDPMGDLLPMPGSHNPSFGPNVGGGSQTGTPSDLGWQDQGSFNSAADGFNAGGNAYDSSGLGLYNTDIGAYWSYYYATSGNLGGMSLYHRGKGTADDPTTGNLGIALTIANAALTAPGGLKYTLYLLSKLGQYLSDHIVGGDKNGLFLKSYNFEGGTPRDGISMDIEKEFVSWGALGTTIKTAVQIGGNNPDVAGVTLNLDDDDEIIGAGMTVSAFLITHGENEGFYVSGTASLVVGDSNGLGVGVFTGKYWGRGDPDPSTILGSTFNISSTQSNGLYSWKSFSGIPYFSNLNWSGYGIVVGITGGSLQFGDTLPLYGFPRRR